MSDTGEGKVLTAGILAGLLWLAWKRARAPAVASVAAETAAALPNESALLNARLEAGETDENVLTDLLFFGRHPERQYAAIRPAERTLAAEWLAIRDNIVRPALTFRGAGASGTF